MSKKVKPIKIKRGKHLKEFVALDKSGEPMKDVTNLGWFTPEGGKTVARVTFKDKSQQDFSPVEFV